MRFKQDKFTNAVQNLKNGVLFSWQGEDITTEEEFNTKVDWEIDSTDEANPIAITQKECPHPEITWTKVKAEMDRLEADYVSKEYARNRLQQYPNNLEFIEAYTEKEIGGDSTKWDAYVVKYNKVRSDVPKP